MKLEKLLAKGDIVDVYQSGSLAIKVFKNEEHKSKALYEALTQARIENTGLNVPKIHEVRVIDGKWAIAMDCIEGETYSELMKKNPDKINEYIDKMVDIQLEIHSKRSEKLYKFKDQMKRQIQSLDIDSSLKYDLLTRLDSTPKHVKVCHGNFTPINIIESGEKTYVLDWVAATQGNASADVATTYLLLTLEFGKETAEYYMDNFCEKSGTAKKYVQQWLPIVAAARLTLGKEEEKELLNKWINVVDYE